MTPTSSSKLRLDDWKLPPRLPRFVDDLTTIGVPMPYYPEPEDFIEAWNFYDPLNWELDDLNRREWETEILSNFDSWKRYLCVDSTPVFKKTVAKKRSKGGILIGIRGIKGGGKSRLAQMVIGRICTVTPHVLFQYKDIGAQFQSLNDEVQEVGLLIDEDLTATGADSANLVIHVNNSWDTNRKAVQSGVCTGVNLSFEKWGNTLDIRLEPCGYNERFLATRFGMFSSKNRFLGFGALQFKHLPDDPVYYYNELGTWSQYDDRASLFSRTVTRSGGALDAIDDIEQTKHIERLKKLFTTEYIEKERELPPDIACRRLYRKAKLPAKSIGYMNEVIWWAKNEFEEKKNGKKGEVPFDPKLITGENWEWLRDAYRRWGEEAYALYMVPNKKQATWDDIALVLGETPIPEGASLGRRIRRRLSGRTDYPPSTKELGDMGEGFIMASLPDTFGARRIGGIGNPDILCTINNRPVALSIKFTEKDTHYKERERHPEYDAAPDNAFCILIMPRLLTIHIFRITGSSQTINTRLGTKGHLATTHTPQEIGAILQEVVK